jgi:hypothetical protein
MFTKLRKKVADMLRRLSILIDTEPGGGGPGDVKP